MDSCKYPRGSDTLQNQTGKNKREIEVLVSVTLSKTVKVWVNDYEIIDCGYDKEGYYFESIDYSGCDLKSAVKRQIILPQEASNYFKFDKEGSKFYRDLTGWNVDEMECIIDN